jgi:SPX domain protein involved in polyphosphate accumulation
MSTGATRYQPSTVPTGKPPAEVIKTAEDTISNMNNVGQNSNFMNAVDPIVQNVYGSWKSKNDELMKRIQALKGNN